MNNVIKSVHKMLLFIALASMEVFGTPEPSMLAYTEYASRRRPQAIINYVVPLDSCTWALIMVISQMR